MTVTVGAYSLCDGTLAGGVAVSELRVNQRRVTDLVAVIPQSFRVSLSSAGTGYVIEDLLSISADGFLAVIQVSLTGSLGEIVNYQVVSNNFNANESSLSATGGTGTGATFSVSSASQPNRSNPVAFDRRGRPSVYAFTVKRTHPDADSAESFIIGLEDAIPSSGAINVTTTGPIEATFTIPNGKVQSHELVQQLGATTFHSYSIIGGPPTTV